MRRSSRVTARRQASDPTSPISMSTPSPISMSTPSPISMSTPSPINAPDELVSLADTLQSLITSEDGKLPFRQPVHLSPYIRLRGLQWYYGSGLFNDEEHLTIAVDLQAMPFSGLHGLAFTSRCANRREALYELLQRARDLRHCQDCCATYPQQQLSGGQCAGCHIARVFTPESHTCSICQEPAERWYRTKCGHHFHFGCLSELVEDIRNSRQVLPQWIDASTKYPLKCPNCRAPLEGEFLTYLTVDDRSFLQ